MHDLTKVLLGALAGAVITAPASGFIGWRYKCRELDRVELRSRLSTLENQTCVLRDKGIEYWRTSGKTEQSAGLARDIKSKEAQLGLELRALYRLKSKSPDEIENRRTTLRKAITGFDFEGRDRLASDFRCNDISTETARLLEQLRRDFGIV